MKFKRRLKVGEKVRLTIGLAFRVSEEERESGGHWSTGNERFYYDEGTLCAVAEIDNAGIYLFRVIGTDHFRWFSHDGWARLTPLEQLALEGEDAGT